MKKTMLKLMIALLSVSSLSVASIHAADDDFETLLNALNEGSVAEETAPAEETTAPAEETTAPAEETTAPVNTSEEIDLESMMDVTEPVITNTYSNESPIIEDTEIEFEPETTTAPTPIFENVEDVKGVEDDMNTYTAARDNRAPQLTVTWMEDAIYLVILIAIMGGLFFARRRKAI